MPTATLYKMEDDCTLTEPQNGDVSVLENNSWKFFIPVSTAARTQQDLVAFSDAEIAYFENNGNGTFAQKNWAVPQDRPDVSQLDLGRNACAGHFTDDPTNPSLIDLFAEIHGPPQEPPPPRKFAIWRITANGLIRLPVEFVTDFPWVNANAKSQHLVAGDFFADSPQDDLLFYQGNENQEGDTGTMQLLRIGFTTTPRLTNVRSTWSSIVPMRTPGRTRVLLFDDGEIVTNHRGRRFVAFPYAGKNPTAPWAEVRFPRPGGHLTLMNLDPQPDVGTGPDIRRVSNRPVKNREVVAGPSPFRPFTGATRDYKFKRVNENIGPPNPENMDWWNLRRRNDECQFCCGTFSREGKFFQVFYSLPPNNYMYRVLNKNLQIVSGNADIRLPQQPLPDVILPGDFAGDARSELLFYSRQ